MFLNLNLQTSSLNCDLPAMETNGSEQPESVLMERFRSGDAEAFTALYRRHYAEVARFAMYMMGDGSKAEELSQDVFVWLVDHPKAYESRFGSLPVFLKGVARNLARRRWRNERRWHSLDEMTRGQHAAQELIAPPKELSAVVDAAVLRKAINRLAPKYREAIVLCDLEGESYEEAARVLECPVGTVRSRLHRARRLLTEQFERNDRRRQ